MVNGLNAGVGPASFLEIVWTVVALIALVALLYTTAEARRVSSAMNHWTDARPVHRMWANGNLRRRYERCYFAFAYLVTGAWAMALPPNPSIQGDMLRTVGQLVASVSLIIANLLLARGAVLDVLEDRRVMDALFSGELTGG